MGNTKRLLQVLWERIFIDTYKDVCNYYTLRGKEDNYGNTILETILRELMQNFLKCIKEEKILQNNDCKLG